VPTWNYQYPTLWYRFRLNLLRMTDIIGKTQRWRATCNADRNIAAVMNQDFVVVRYATQSLLASANGCIMVDAVNIRGYSCTSCYVYAQQATIGSTYRDHMRINSASGSSCSPPYLPTTSSISNEKNFGYYDVTNSNFGCTSSPSSTTNVSSSIIALTC
jgi:hypothetical protein